MERQLDLPFTLPTEFVKQYRGTPAPFGFDGLGEFTAHRTYYRIESEDMPPPYDSEWADVVERVVDGMYSMLREKAPVWDEGKAQRSAQESYDLLYNLKWSPPGRGLWAMGTPFVHDRKHPEALQNCAFISSRFINEERGDFFGWIMNQLMMGVGVGFDLRGAGLVEVHAPRVGLPRTVVIPDSREGWAASLRLLVNTYLIGGQASPVVFDYSELRAKGAPIKGFGGRSSGSGPLQELHTAIKRILGGREGQQIGMKAIADIGNLIGVCVIAGNVRRSAEIMLGPPVDAFLDLKDYEKNPDRVNHGWASNNSVYIDDEWDTVANENVYTKIAERAYENGEPGVVWLGNARKYARMNGLEVVGDEGIIGFNPCGEIGLHHREMCTLTEVFLPRISSKREFARVVKHAYLYAKATTLSSEYMGDMKTRSVMMNNGRIGLSLTGIAQFVENNDTETLIDWMDFGYQLVQMWDDYYSTDWLGVPKALRTTTVKPSGTVSLLAGVTPGVHYPVAEYYIRRVRVADDSPLVERALKAGFYVEPDKYSSSTAVVEFIASSGGTRAVSDVSLQEQMQLAQIAAEHWADNAVSFTAMFDKEKSNPGTLAHALEVGSGTLKSLSFLPLETDQYEQMPYEALTREEYEVRLAGTRKIDLTDAVRGTDHLVDEFCDTDVCDVNGNPIEDTIVSNIIGRG